LTEQPEDSKTNPNQNINLMLTPFLTVTLSLTLFLTLITCYYVTSTTKCIIVRH